MEFFSEEAAEPKDELLEVLRRHRVFARQGDTFDPLNFHDDRNVATNRAQLAVALSRINA